MSDNPKLKRQRCGWCNKLNPAGAEICAACDYVID